MEKSWKRGTEARKKAFYTPLKLENDENDVLTNSQMFNIDKREIPGKTLLRLLTKISEIK